MRRAGYGSGNGVFYLRWSASALDDQLHSTTAIVDATGALQAQQYYYPYGANRGGAQSDLTDKRFTGQYHESGLAGAEGLYYYNARWYDPALARFAQADTLVPEPGNPQSLNRYAYVYNNPARYTDPSGHAVPIDARATFLIRRGTNGTLRIIRGGSVLSSREKEWANYILSGENEALLPGYLDSGAFSGYGDDGALRNAERELARASGTTARPLTKSERIAADPIAIAGAGTALGKMLSDEQGEYVTGPGGYQTRFLSGVTVSDGGGISTLQGTVDLGPTFDRIARGESYPHRNDGLVFQNRGNPLPPKDPGYYHEYVVPTSGIDGPGRQRLVIGNGGEAYYTPDHYVTFIRVR